MRAKSKHYGKRAGPLKLPDDFLGTVRAFLQTQPPPKGKKKRKGARKGKVTK